MTVHLNTKEQAAKLLEAHDTFLFDCDGVLWSGSQLLPHVKETLDLLRKHGKQLVFVTNNSTKSRKQYVAKFKKFGIDVNHTEIFGSAYSSAVYLDKKVTNFDRENQKVLVVGEKGLEEELHEAGFKTCGGSDPSLNRDFSSEDENTLAKRDPSIGAVVCGLDVKINYLKMAIAQAQIRAGVPFLATNIDSTFPSNGRVLPGAGSIIKAVSFCSDREPDAVLGKPSKAMMDCIEARFQFDPKRAVMVGDRLNTDMKFGANSGLDTLFVLTGIDTVQNIEKSGVNPTFYADRLGVLYELLGA